ncbi:unnamed protein product [Aphis gossypii]|uniref:Uncharacterized protein n=1 Tax=Aphis gossypii TaxID=80765 RepID=A0A9P0NLU1_APHGO|nr:unnamed protein product [Aphis gossypii]
MVRQASGPNDHPSTPTFIHIYKILSSYSILKPPKSGNCTILETSAPKITLSDIKQIVDTDSSERADKIRNLSIKLDTLIDEGVWEAEDIFDHDYTKSSVKDCVCYYICGYVSKQIIKHTKCKECTSAIVAGKFA